MNQEDREATQVIQSAESFLATTKTTEVVSTTSTYQRKETSSRTARVTKRSTGSSAPAAIDATAAPLIQPEPIQPEPIVEAPASIAPPSSPAVDTTAPAESPAKRASSVEAIVEPAIAVLPLRMQPYAQQVVEMAKPYVEQTVETVKPYADRAAATAAPIVAATKETVSTVSTRTKEGVLATAQRVQPYVDATVETAAKARSATNDVIGTTKERLHETSEAIAAAKAQATVKKDEYVAFGKGTARSYFERIAKTYESYVQPYVDISKERLTFIRATTPADVIDATKNYAAAKKDEVIQRSKETAQVAVENAKVMAKPYVEKAQPLVEKTQPYVRATLDCASSITGKAAEKYEAVALNTSNAKQSASTFVEAQQLRFLDAKKRLMSALVPCAQEQAEPQEGAEKPRANARIFRFVYIPITLLTAMQRKVFATVAESERLQGAARTWKAKTTVITENARFQRINSIVMPYATACFSFATGVVRKSAAVFQLVGKPVRAST